MENSRFKVELWTDEIEKACRESKLLQFHSTDNDVLRITNTQYEDVFSYLTKRKTLLISQNDDESSEDEGDLKEIHVSKAEIQSEILDRLIEKNKKSLEKYGRYTTYVSFGILDYTDVDKKHEVKSAPLVFIPVKIEKNKGSKTYQISAVNDEISLNENLVAYMRKARNIDLSYPVSSDFSLVEYLTFIAPKAYRYRWSVNNGVFLSDFDLTSQKVVDDYIANQEKIAEVSLIKSVSYYNAEFYSFNKPNGTKLSRKLLSLLPLDNDEYHVMQKVANRENLFIRTDSLDNQSHLINNMISAFLINNKKVLVVYNEKSQKDAFFDRLDKSLIPYCQDLNEFSIDKDVLLDRLTSYDLYQHQKGTIDPLSMQELLNKYYDVRNDFKKTINSLRKKQEPFGLSLNAVIENYYQYDNDMIDIKIPHITEMTPLKLEEYLDSIHEFTDSLRALRVNYKDHIFYGFDKKVMMQEEYLPLKTSFTILSEDIKKLNILLIHLHEKFELPYANNLKLTKALLNVLSVLDAYRTYPASFFEELDLAKAITQMNELNSLITSLKNLKENMIQAYGDKIFDIDQALLDKSTQDKGLTRKEMKMISTYYALKEKEKLSTETLANTKKQMDEYHHLEEQISSLTSELHPSLLPYFKDDLYDVETIQKAKASVDLYRLSKAYFIQNRLPLALKQMDQFRDDTLFNDAMKYRKRMQILFNSVLDNTNIIQPYFNEEIINYAVLPFDQYMKKAEKISKNFISINKYLDFYVSLHRMNQLIPNLGNHFLEVDDYSLYDKMFMKRFYYDYAQYLMNSLRKNTYTDTYIFGSIETYQKSEEERVNLFETLINNYYTDFLHAHLGDIRRSELGALEAFKDAVGIRPLARITNVVPESIYHMFPCLAMPLNSVASLCANDHFHFDAVIILASHAVETKETLSALYRADQTIVFDTQYLSRDPKLDYIDKNNVENFISAAKRAFEYIEFVSKSYKIIPLRSNTRNKYFKKYLIEYLKSQGFEVATDIALNKGAIDMIVRMPLRQGYTCISVDSLPYHSIESAKETFEASKTIVNDAGYSYLRVFPFAFFMDEEKAKSEISSYIVENSMKTIERKKRVVQKKLTDALFETYIFPAEIYYAYRGKDEISRKDLMLSILKRTMPVKKDDIVSLFGNDALELLSLLLAEEKIYEKDNFIFVFGEPIVFRSSKEKLRSYENVHPLEIQDGIIRMVKMVKDLSEDSIIKMILLSLGHRRMNAKMYQYVGDIITDLVKNNTLSLEEGIVNFVEEKE